LDVTQEHCPMTFVKTKLALDKLREGDLLAVTVTAGEPLDNIPRTAAEQGFTVRSVQPASTPGTYTIEIER
jgi:TusA-related sulfurtransferase